jgi:hypothetical protein
MFNLQEGDLKIAKVLWNIVIPMFLGSFILFSMGIEVPFGFFNIIVTVSLYYALKLCTDKEKSLMTPFFLFAVGSAVYDAFMQGDAIAYGADYDEYAVGTHLFFMMILLASYWGFESIVPNWARVAVLIAGIGQIVATYSSLIDDTALHDIADTSGLLMLVFFIGLRNAVVKAANNA